MDDLKREKDRLNQHKNVISAKTKENDQLRKDVDNARKDFAKTH